MHGLIVEPGGWGKPQDRIWGVAPATRNKNDAHSRFLARCVHRSAQRARRAIHVNAHYLSIPIIKLT
jgi:hypothetical protein